MYDDGSYDVTVGGATYAYDTSGAPYSSVSADGIYSPAAGFYQDRLEQAKFGQYYPGNDPYWKNFAMYGATRALDAFFGPKVMPANTSGTYAGENGKTYSQGKAVSKEKPDDSLIMLMLAGFAFYALAA